MSSIDVSRTRSLHLPSWSAPLFVALFSLLAAGLVWVDAPVAPRLPIGLLAVLLFPGYALSLLVIPEPGELSWAERLALSFGLSLASVAVLALALHHTPWGLTETPFVIAVTGCSVVTSIAAALRPRGRASATAATALVGWRDVGRRGWIVVSVAVATACVAIAALVVVTTEPPPPFTEFFVLGQEGLVEQYPRMAEPGQTITVTAGITNRETAPLSYRVVVQDGLETLATSGPMLLAPGETWLGTISFALAHPGKDQDISLNLYIGGTPEPYRTLHLWIDGATVRTDGAGQPSAQAGRSENG